LKSDLIGKRIAGIDFGTKRIGVAVCDELHISVKPVKTIHTDKDDIFESFTEIFRNERVEACVIGMPETRDGKENAIAGKIRKMADTINKKFNLEIFFVDESFSSKQAGGFMINYGIKKKSRAKKGMLDMYSAVIILEQFLSELE